jgi:uncharacterized protein YprB with RNaseH-like and TPR domain
MENLLRKRLQAITNRARTLRDGWLGGGRDRDREARRDDESFDLTLHGPAEAIETVAPGEVRGSGDDAFYLVRHEGDAIADDAGGAGERMVALATQPSWPFSVLDIDLYTGSRRPLDPSQVCFFDIETTGLMPNTYCFLSGVMLWRDGRFVVEQMFARDYGEEAAALAYLNEVFAAHSVIVTYNGATFDLPFVRARMAATGVGLMTSSDHLDLLWPARRRYRGELPNCRLSTIERHLRGVDREGDIPGRYIPEAYHRFVDTGDARHMGNVLYHNRMDLLAMAILLNELVERPAPRVQTAAQGTLF